MDGGREGIIRQACLLCSGSHALIKLTNYQLDKQGTDLSVSVKIYSVPKPVSRHYDTCNAMIFSASGGYRSVTAGHCNISTCYRQREVLVSSSFRENFLMVQRSRRRVLEREFNASLKRTGLCWKWHLRWLSRTQGKEGRSCQTGCCICAASSRELSFGFYDTYRWKIPAVWV